MAVTSPDTGFTFDGFEPFGSSGIVAVGISDWINVAGCKQLLFQFAPKSGAGANDFEVKIEAAANSGNGMASPVALVTKDGTDGDTSYEITDNKWAFVRLNVTKLTSDGNPSYVMVSGREC